MFTISSQCIGEFTILAAYEQVYVTCCHMLFLCLIGRKGIFSTPLDKYILISLSGEIELVLQEFNHCSVLCED